MGHNARLQAMQSVLTSTVRRLDHPFKLSFAVTYRCNLRCRHCYQEGYARGRELELPALLAVADNLLEAMGAWGCTLDVALTGGEPLIKEEFYGLLAHHFDAAGEAGAREVLPAPLCP